MTVSPQSRPPLFVLARTSESQSRVASAVLVGRTRRGLRSELRDLRGLHWTQLGSNEVIRWHRPLLSFTSRSESYSSVLTALFSLAPDGAREPEEQHPTLGFPVLRRFQKRTATCARFASPSCAAPSDFLSLLTLYSIRDLSGLFSYR